jgi:hypothetical protein
MLSWNCVPGQAPDADFPMFRETEQKFAEKRLLDGLADRLLGWPRDEGPSCDIL